MKQIIIAGNKPYADTVTPTDLTTLPEGGLALIDLFTNKAIKTNTDLVNNFSVVCGRGKNKMPILFPEVDIRTLSVVKAEYTAGTKYSSMINLDGIDAVESGKIYTIVVTKLGTVFNERNNWTFTTVAKKGDDNTDIAENLVKAIQANSNTSGLTATGNGAITFKGLVEGENYSIQLTDELSGIEFEDVVNAKKAVLDKAYVQDLASRCAAGKGFNDVYQDGDSIYPGYPEKVDADEYVMYTLRFAVPRMSAKQRDEVVYQTLHICVPTDADAVGTLDSIFFPSEGDTEEGDPEEGD